MKRFLIEILAGLVGGVLIFAGSLTAYQYWRANHYWPVESLTLAGLGVVLVVIGLSLPSNQKRSGR